jgi:asparagine synthase (glutamine-hydrolysing)
MCGIAGFYSPENKFNEDHLRAMTDSLKHRGPDAEGFYCNDAVGLGHRRLSIIDLSSRANQPMKALNDRYVIVYNGEVYNFGEIGAKLQKIAMPGDKVNFRTSSDTEVLLEAFSKFGTDFVHELNGMFAFAIYDIQLKDLYLFRDRIGIKPLYYYWDGKNFAFASELKAIKTLPGIELKINTNSIRNFLHLGFIPAPDSIYENIHKLHSGSWMKINDKGIEIKKYWNLKGKITNDVIRDKNQAMVRMSDLLISSVQYQLKSDVPFGVFLSGGIDSSLVTAQAVMLSSLKVNTFSIGFEENSHNESEYAKAVARYLGTDHHEFMVSYKDAINLIDSITDTYDEPFADSSCIPTMLVSKLAKQYVTVTLSGEGGDELFFGYGAYKWAHRLNNPFMQAIRLPASALLGRLSSRYKRVSKLLHYEDSRDKMSHIFSQEQCMFTDNEIDHMLTDEFLSAVETPVSKSFQSLLRVFYDRGHDGMISVSERKLNVMEQQALYDLEVYLQDDLLTKVDRASMKFSIETRVPYLDHRLIEFALNIAPELKYHGGVYKYILKEILYQYIPKRLFDRPKQGFSIPLNKWLHTALRYLVEDYLCEPVIKKFGVVKYEEVERLKQEFFTGSDYLFNRIWLLITLHMWFVKNESHHVIAGVSPLTVEGTSSGKVSGAFDLLK